VVLFGTDVGLMRTELCSCGGVEVIESIEVGVIAGPASEGL